MSKRVRLATGMLLVFATTLVVAVAVFMAIPRTEPLILIGCFPETVKAECEAATKRGYANQMAGRDAEAAVVAGLAAALAGTGVIAIGLRVHRRPKRDDVGESELQL